MTPHLHTVTIYYEDTDLSGSVYHANYLKYFERAREHFFGVERLAAMVRETGIAWVVYRCEVKFKAPARHGDCIEIRTTPRIESDYRVTFEQDEPFCSIVPIQKAAVLECRPEIRPLSDNPELEAQAKAWRTERFHFNARLYSGDPEALRGGWSKRYFRGERMDGTPVDGHVNKLRFKEPLDRSK